MKKERLTKFNADNPLGWSEADFRDVICNMCNIKIANFEPLTPLLNVYYLENSCDWYKDKLLED